MSGIVLTAEEITSLLANGRNKGGNERFLKEFDASEEIYAIVNEHPNYKGKDKGQMVSVKNALTAKAKALDLTHIRLVKRDDTIIVVNTALLEASEETSDEDQ